MGSAQADRFGEPICVRYQPGRRALFRSDGTYMKLRADGRAPLSIPGAPRALRHEAGVTVYEEAPGLPLRQCERMPWIEPVGEALARLHANASTCPRTTWGSRRATCGRRPRPRRRPLPFRALEPGWPGEVRGELSRERLAGYRRSASSVITAS